MKTLAIVIAALFTHGLIMAQCPTGTEGCPCTAHRYTKGDAWNPDGTVNFKPGPHDPAGIIGCFTPANTESTIGPNTTYNPTNFTLPTLTNCLDPQTGLSVGNLAPPNPGQKILWYNFDLRPYVQWFDFQVIGSGHDVAWALFCSVSPTSGLMANGLSGDCDDLVYHLCGTNFNGWAPTPFFNMDFTTAANYYVMVWDRDPSNDHDFHINFKGRFGCAGDPVFCYAEQTGISTFCNGDGSYTVTAEFAAVNGTYNVVDNTAQAVSSASSPDPLVLTNPSCSDPKITSCTEVTTGEVSLVYPAGVNYDFSIAEVSAAGPIATQFSCNIDISGLAPVCVPSLLTISPVSTDATCYEVCNGIVSASTVGGTPPYTYFWNKGLGAGQTHSNACDGFYMVSVTDAASNTGSALVLVGQPTAILVSTTSSPISGPGLCDGDLGASASGGTPPYSYLWNKGIGAGANHTDVACPDFYSVIVTDAAGCTAQGFVRISDIPTIPTMSEWGLLALILMLGSFGLVMINRPRMLSAAENS